MRPFWLLAASVALCGIAHAQTDTLVVELRLGTRAVEALAWREDDGTLLIERETADALGLRVPDSGDRVALQDIPGLSFSLDASNAAIVLSCTAACYRETEIGAAPRRTAIQRGNAGGFFNADLNAFYIDDRSAAAGAFELGLFGPRGSGGMTFIASTEERRATRLETQWTFDRPAERLRLRVGDSVTRGGATGSPFRFGGVQLATDFSLDHGFIPFPTPTLRGEAAAPSTVDLYVDGALRMRRSVDAGPFSIIDAPIVSGPGVAQIVVTDALGRQQIFAQSFYSSPSMLRAGLNDYSLVLGAERRNFTQRSDDYGRGFASAVVRRGVTDWFTGELRAEGGGGGANVGVGGSVAAAWLGQIDGALALSEGERDGAMMRLGWQRTGRILSFGIETQTQSRNFSRLGEDVERAPLRRQVSASAGVNLDRLGAASIAYVTQNARDDAEDVETVSLSYTPRDTRRGSLNFQAFYVNDDEESFVTLGVGYSVQLRGDVNVGARAETRRGETSAFLSAQRPVDSHGGYGWYARGATGEVDRFDVGVQHIGSRHEASLEASHTNAGDGLRGTFATGIAWIGTRGEASRPVRQSFALVDVGAPNVRVLRDRRVAGTTGRDGRLLLTGLRPYEPNRIGVALDDLPMDSALTQDEIDVTPAARSGVIASFEITHGEAGEVRLAGADGSALPAGTVLTRGSDGARFVVGSNGRTYITGLDGEATFAAEGCAIRIAPAQLDQATPLRCEGMA